MDPLPIDQARRPSTMAENRRFMNFFIMQGSLYDLTLVAQFGTFYKTFAQKSSKIGHQRIYR